MSCYSRSVARKGPRALERTRMAEKTDIDPPNDEKETNPQSDLSARKANFIAFMANADVLRFGQFVTKSGRESPYFVNTGLYRTGDQIRQLGRFYAEAILDEFGGTFDVLFGPAYKGIPLVVSTAIALAEQGHPVDYCFNRKEQKDHGEGGWLVGHQLNDGDRVLIVEDITTAGTAIRDVVPMLTKQADVCLAGLIVSVDRCEKGPNEQAALTALADEFEMKTHAIVSIYDILAQLEDRAQRALVEQYLERYGA